MEIVLISNEDNFLRRVPTWLPNLIKDDGSISSAVFKTKRGDDGLSGDAESLIVSYQQAVLNQPEKFRLLKVNVGTVRNQINDGLDVIHNPIIDHPEIQDNYAHCLIIGNITDGKAKQLLKCSAEVSLV